MAVESDSLLRTVYAANIAVAGTVGALSLFLPESGGRGVFSNLEAPGPAMAVSGSFWIAVAVSSALGLLYPRAFAAVLVVQLVYKGLWLVAFALPAYARGEADRVPTGIAAFFAVWVLALPFVIPFRELMR